MPLDLDIFGEGIYTPRQAARLLHGTSQEVLRWTRGSGPSLPLWENHYHEIEDSVEISFADLVELRVVKAFRSAGIPLQAIRYAISIAQSKFNIQHPLSSLNFKTDGTEILMDAVEQDGEYVSLSKKRPGQKVFATIVNQSISELEYDGNSVARWRPGKTKNIILDPSRSFGEPLLDESGISTHTLYKEFKISKSAKYLSNLYEIELRHVKQAIKFESALDLTENGSNGKSSI